MRTGEAHKATSYQQIQLKKRETSKQLVVSNEAPVGPIHRPPKPASIDPTRGKKIIETYIFFLTFVSFFGLFYAM